MAETAQNIINLARNTFPDMTTAKGVFYMNNIQKRLVHELGIRLTSKTISLTSGTREYTLGGTVATIEAVNYSTSATAWVNLTPTSTSELDIKQAGWEVDPATGTPYSFYIRPVLSGTTTDAFKIGFYPTPDTTTATGYPIVRIDYADNQDFTVAGVASETIPESVMEPLVYVQGLRWLHCVDTRPGEAEIYYAAFAESLERCREFNVGMITNNPPEIRFDFFQGQSSI